VTLFARTSLLVALAVETACSSARDPPRCMGTEQSSVVNGSSEETYLGLGAAELRAIVEIVDGTLAGTAESPLCSGAFVTKDWVVTARHCLLIRQPNVVVAPLDESPGAILPVLEAVSSPTVDVALLRVDASGLAGPLAPLAAADELPRGVHLGTPVEFAGYGLTEGRTAHELRFAVEPITSIDGESIVVDGHGASGACDGDSGGPLLARGTNGAARVLGVLAFGSATCVDDDSYERLDALAPWILATAGPAPVATDCGSISAEGRCLFAGALWCDGGTLAAAECDAGTHCAFSAEDAGFRCVAGAADPCARADP